MILTFIQLFINNKNNYGSFKSICINSYNRIPPSTGTKTEILKSIHKRFFDFDIKTYSV